jgi:uncharacterized membrane protein YdjX (TVP38/TMEM64 family)
MKDILGLSHVQWYSILLMAVGIFLYYFIGMSLSGILSKLVKLLGTCLTWIGFLFYLIEHINKGGH